MKLDNSLNGVTINLTYTLIILMTSHTEHLKDVPKNKLQELQVSVSGVYS